MIWARHTGVKFMYHMAKEWAMTTADGCLDGGRMARKGLVLGPWLAIVNSRGGRSGRLNVERPISILIRHTVVNVGR